jgi:sulfide:quinone oxidoreductase
MQFGHELTAIDGPAKKATVLDKATGQTTEMGFDMIHVTPPMGPMDVIKNSPLADDGGWLAVDKYTMQSTKFANVFGLGDCINAPCAKTGAAVRKQSPVLVRNLSTCARMQYLIKYNQ